MYVDIGMDLAVRASQVLGVFDLDNTSWSKRTREFLQRAQERFRSKLLRNGGIARKGEKVAVNDAVIIPVKFLYRHRSPPFMFVLIMKRAKVLFVTDGLQKTKIPPSGKEEGKRRNASVMPQSAGRCAYIPARPRPCRPGSGNACGRARRYRGGGC